uniref:Mom family adenine methylcarbamoylation protein n=1 Tax=Nonomuraea sp. CA-251285 TaxID=3240002 RepID=UPI003F49100E
MAVSVLPEVNPASDWCQRCGPGKTHTWVHRRDGGFDADRYTVDTVNAPVAKAFVEANHYSGEYPADIKRYGLFDRYALDADRRPTLVGVMILSVPMNVKALTNPFPGLEPFEQSAELGRFCLLPTPGNAETHFLREGFELAREEGIRGIVSFADPMPRVDASGQIVMPGHIGAIYRDKGLRYAGRSTPGYTTVMPDGLSLSERSQQKVRKDEQGHEGVERRLVENYGATPRESHEDGRVWLRRELQRIGAVRFRHRGKHRYLACLGGKVENRFMVSAKFKRGLPYPTRPDKSPLPGVDLVLAARGQENLFELAR